MITITLAAAELTLLLVCAFLVGPAANFFLPRSEKLTAAIISICLKISPENGDHK